MTEHDRTASLMSPGKLARLKPQPAATPEAWLDRMAADVGRLQVENLLDVQQALAQQALERAAGALAGDLQTLAAAWQQLDFNLLQTRGWWARTTGKARSAGAEFAAQVDQIDNNVKAVTARAAELGRGHATGVAATDRTLLNLDVEYRALDKIVEQGAKWLQDMRGQLQQRHAAAATDPAAQQKVREDAARCEILVVRLKALRALSATAQQTLAQTRELLGARGALVQHLSQTLAATSRNWSTRMGSLAAAAQAGSDSPELSVEAPQEIHRQLQQHVAQALAGCARLASLEEAAATSLDQMAQQIAAARAA
jgi:hypothetical protein